MIELGRAFLIIESLPKAQQCCTQALALEVPEIVSQEKKLLGIVLLHQRDSSAKNAFADAVTHSRTRVDRAANLYGPHYILATALVGQAVCDPRWEDESQRPELLAPALEEYRRALEITAAPGIVQDAIRDLELIQTAGIEGLEPAFELLENAEYEPDLPEDLPNILEEVA